MDKQEIPEILIDPQWLEWEYIRSRGPGGQKVNKTSSKVRLRFNLRECLDLPPVVKQRLFTLAQGRINEQGLLILESETSRQQSQNKQICLDKLHALIRKSLITPKRRRPTRPTTASRLRRLHQKMHRSRLKTQRRKTDTDE